MFLKSAIYDMESFFNSKMSSEKIHFKTSCFFKKKNQIKNLNSLAARGQTPPPSRMSSKECNFFYMFS